MKRLIQNYTFDKTAKTITILGEQNITLDKMLLITNISKGIIIFNFADATQKASILGNVITLTYDTSLMANDDILQIWIEEIEVPLIDLGLIARFLKNTFKFVSFDATSNLRVVPSGGSVSTVTTANVGFGDLGKPSSGMIANNSFAKTALNNFVRS